MNPQDKGDVFENRFSAQKLEVLKNHTHFASQQRQASPMKLVHPPPGHPDLAFGRPFGGVKEPQEGRLAGARGPGEKNELAGFDLEVEGTEDEPALEILGNIAQPNHEPRRAPCDFAELLKAPPESRIVSLGPRSGGDHRDQV